MLFYTLPFRFRCCVQVWILKAINEQIHKLHKFVLYIRTNGVQFVFICKNFLIFLYNFQICSFIDKRKRRPRSCAYAVDMSNRDVAESDYAEFEGKIIPIAARGISGTEKTVLGTAYVGARIFLWDGRGSRSGNNSKVYREPGKGRKRRQFHGHDISCFSRTFS